MKFSISVFKHFIILFITYETVLGTCAKSCPPDWISKFNKCYYVHKEPLTWNDASSWCKANNANLAQIDNENEFQFLKELYLLGIDQSVIPYIKYYWEFFSKDAPLWIGGKRTSTTEFSWPDGSLVPNSWWCEDEPNNFNGIEPYVCFWLDGCLNDFNYFDSIGFICEA